MTTDPAPMPEPMRNALEWFDKIAAEYTGFGMTSAAEQPRILREEITKFLASPPAQDAERELALNSIPNGGDVLYCSQWIMRHRETLRRALTAVKKFEGEG